MIPGTALSSLQLFASLEKGSIGDIQRRWGSTELRKGCPMQMVARLGKRFKTWRVRRVQRKWVSARRNRVLLFAFGFCVVCAFLWLHPQIMTTGGKTPPLLRGAVSFTDRVSGSGKGAGGTGAQATAPQIPAAPSLCNPFDTNCLADGVASWLATNIQNALQPIADVLSKSPSNLITQTPLLQGDSQDTPLLTINNVLIGVMDATLVCLLVIGAYNAMVGHHLNMLHASLSELLPRAILVVGAVHFNQLFLADFIDFENALSLAIIHAVGLNMLTNIIAGIFTNPITAIIPFILMVVLAIMVILLLIQMITRLALVAVCVATAPLGLGCLMLPQSMRWGRLWLTLFASSVMVQFLQVTALGLGGAFITALAATSLPRLDIQLATAFLAIGILGLVLKIPGILQNWALHPMMDGFNGGSSSGQSAQNTGGSGSGGGDMGGSMASGGDLAGAGSAGSAGGSQMMNGTVVTEESGTLLLLF